MRFPWKKNESELERELAYHLDCLADAFERQGMGREEALARARREFGGIEQAKENCRDERRWRLLASLMQDLTFGARMLRKAPGVTGAAVLSLALGIGATTAIVSLVDAVLWRTLAVPQPEQLADIVWQSKGRPEGVYQNASGSMFPEGPLVVADFFSRQTFDALRTTMAGRVEIAGHLHPTDVSAAYSGVSMVATLRPVSGNFFAMLRLQPSIGRLLTPGDDNAGAPLAVTVSHLFWRKYIGGNPGVAGRTLRINNRIYTITGVLPSTFSGITVGDSTDLYTPIAHAPAMLDPNSFERRFAWNPQSWYLQLLGRKMAPVPLETLAPEMDAVFRSTWVREPTKPDAAPLIRLREASGGIGGLRREFGNPLLLLFALVACVLLVCCANIANLMLARADTRRKEVALRVSLGCSRPRLIRQFFTESLLLASFGGAFSLAVAYATANSAVTLIAPDLRLAFDLDARMIFATIAITAGTALTFGLYPAWRSAQTDAAPALKEGSGSVGGVRHGWLAPGKVLVFGQVALGVLLLAAGAAFTTHLRSIIARDTGFERSRLLMFDLRPGESGYRDARLRQFYTQLEQRLGDIPGVERVGLSRIRPMRGAGFYDDIRIEGQPRRTSTAVNFVTSGYLSALGVRIVAGRGITESDVNARANVAVISEDVASDIGRSPLGMTFRMEDNKPFQIVGVAARARYSRLTEEETVLYLPNALEQDSATAILRTSVPPTQLLSAVNRAVADMDATLPVVDPVTMEEQIAMTLRRERLFAWLCGAFGVLALILCMIGLYGVMSYATARRTQEMGIRMAVGAAPADILRHILGEGLSVALAGCVIGAPLAWWAAQRYIDYKKLGMQPLDPAVLAAATAALALAALLAVLGPAIRAASSDPMKALREG
jgi:predicted permease